ncbi:MAG: 7-cyano-7-deazaguanine synthase QueC [Halobacteriota archaeon]|nr:7-cyano-7-deazaguanine synthase QueC [Halobacteriota archaeon]
MGDDRVNGHRKAVCLCSGGLDSTVSTTIAKEEGHDLYILHLNYGHRAENKEIEAVISIASQLDAREVKFVDLSFLKELGGSSLTDFSVPVPVHEEVKPGETPSTWVPCRNLVFLSLASSYAEVIKADFIFTGFNAEEAQSYPDNTEVFSEKFNEVLREAVASFTKPPLVKAPLVKMFKSDIMRKAVEVKAPIELTWSCYLDYEKHCGKCEACRHRSRGFIEANIEDPTEYMG